MRPPPFWIRHVAGGAICALLQSGAIALVQAAPAVGDPWPTAEVAPRPRPDSRALPDRPLGLAELTAFALANNPASRTAWASALADVAGVDAARALTLPRAEFSAPLSFMRGSDGVKRDLTPTLSLAYVLFDAGGREAGVAAARWQALAGQLIYNRTLQTVVNNVEQAYYSLLANQQLLAALALSVAAAQASFDTVQAKRSAGLATIGEFFQAQAALSAAKLQRTRAEGAVAKSRGLLASLLGVAVENPLQLAEEDPEAAHPLPNVRRQVAALLAQSRRSRVDLAALDAQVRAAEASLISTAAQGKPSLVFAASIARPLDQNGVGASTGQLTLALSIPVFDGGLAHALTRQAQARIDLLSGQRDEQRLAIELEVWQSYHDGQTAQSAIGDADTLLASATEAEAAARERYRAGVGTLLDLLVTQSTSAQARVTRVQARYDGFLALARLGYAVGLYAPLAGTAQ